MSNLIRDAVANRVLTQKLAGDDSEASGLSEAVDAFNNPLVSGAAVAGGVGAYAAPGLIGRAGHSIADSSIRNYKGTGALAEELVSKYLPKDFAFETKTPLILGDPATGKPISIGYTKNPAATAHEISHYLDPKIKERLLAVAENKNRPTRLYKSLIPMELKANIDGFNLLRKEGGLWKALKGLPVFGGSAADYLGSTMPPKVRMALGLLGAGGAGYGAYRALKD